MVCENLKVVDRRALRPWGLFTMLRFEKTFEAASRG
jgi:phosphatidylethanolamine/phosphatidyl-N-methylethanolamine N-methyltransferase